MNSSCVPGFWCHVCVCVSSLSNGDGFVIYDRMECTCVGPDLVREGEVRTSAHRLCDCGDRSLGRSDEAAALKTSKTLSDY